MRDRQPVVEHRSRRRERTARALCIAVSIGALAASSSAYAQAPSADPCATVLSAGRHASPSKIYADLFDRCVSRATSALNTTDKQDVMPSGKRRDALITEARALRDAGFDGEAHKKVQEIVRLGGVPHDLRSPTSTLGWSKRRLATIGPPILSGLQLAAAAIGLLLFLCLIKQAFVLVRVRLRKQLRLVSDLNRWVGRVACRFGGVGRSGALAER
jgi:hypothetical protein